jgi:ribosome-associated translation inhibitor RaiA
VHVQVEVEKTTRRHPQEREDERLYRAEANVTVPGRLIRAEGSGDDAERAVVEMKHHLTREIRSWREHLIDARHRGGREAKYSLGVEIEAEHLDRIDDADEERYEEEIQAFAPGASETGASQAGSSEAGSSGVGSSGVGSSEAKDRTETTDREDESWRPGFRTGSAGALHPGESGGGGPYASIDSTRSAIPTAP